MFEADMLNIVETWKRSWRVPRPGIRERQDMEIAELYHASREPEEIDRFHLLSHFGTLKAALDRARSGAMAGIEDPLVYKVELTFDRPLVIGDLFQTNHSWLKLTDHLYYDGNVIGNDERNEIFDAAAPAGSNASGGNEALCRILRNKGYGAIVYRNDHEDRGSTSVIAIDDECVEIVEVVRLSEIADGLWPSLPVSPAPDAGIGPSGTR